MTRKFKTYCEVWLPYWKQGSDLYNSIEKTETYTEAFKDHAERLKCAVQQLETISKIVNNYKQEDISVQADTHHISIEGPEEMIDELLKKEVGFYDNDFEEFLCDDDEDYCCCEE